jgi:hypothetical protein
MKKKHHMSKFVIIFVILSIFSFTALAIWLQFATSVELSATLITCFYGFCCSELWMLASIKKQKIKHNFVDDPNTPEDESEIYSQIYNQGREEALQTVRDILNGNHNSEGDK